MEVTVESRSPGCDSVVEEHGSFESKRFPSRLSDPVSTEVRGE